MGSGRRSLESSFQVLRREDAQQVEGNEEGHCGWSAETGRVGQTGQLAGGVEVMVRKFRRSETVKM